MEPWESDAFLRKRSDLHWVRLERKYLGLVLHDLDEQEGYDERRLIVGVEYSVAVTPAQWAVLTELLVEGGEPDEQEGKGGEVEAESTQAAGGGDGVEWDSDTDGEATGDEELVPYVINEELHRMILLSSGVNARFRRIIRNEPAVLVAPPAADVLLTSPHAGNGGSACKSAAGGAGAGAGAAAAADA